MKLKDIVPYFVLAILIIPVNSNIIGLLMELIIIKLIKKKGWFFRYYVYAYPQLSRKAYPIRFDNMEEVNQHIKFDSAIQKSFQIKKVECFDYDPNR